MTAPHAPKYSARIPSHKVVANEAIARIGLTGNPYQGRHRKTINDAWDDLLAAMDRCPHCPEERAS